MTEIEYESKMKALYYNTTYFFIQSLLSVGIYVIIAWYSTVKIAIISGIIVFLTIYFMEKLKDREHHYRSGGGK